MPLDFFQPRLKLPAAYTNTKKIVCNTHSYTYISYGGLKKLERPILFKLIVQIQ